MIQAQAVTTLRQGMLDDMRLRNMADATRRSYVRSVAGFNAFHGRSPDELTPEDVRDYQLHLVARGLKAASICPIMSALRFLYAVTLDRPEQAARIPLPRKADPLPAILSREEVARLLGCDLLQRPVALLEQLDRLGLELGGEPASRPGHRSPPGWNRSTLATRPRCRGRLSRSRAAGQLARSSSARRRRRRRRSRGSAGGAPASPLARRGTVPRPCRRQRRR
jgi:hypothetical protein